VRVILPQVEAGKYAARHSMVWERKAIERERAESASYLVGMMMRHGNELAGIDTDIGVATGLIAPALCTVARSEQADMIVMCSHGETGFKRWFFGSVAQELIHQSPVPVLALHERGTKLPTPCSDRPVRAIVALDGSPLSETALGPAARLVAALAAPGSRALHLLRVVDIPASGGRWKSHVHSPAITQMRAKLEAEAYLEAVMNRLRYGPLAGLELAITTSVEINANVAGGIITLAEHDERTGCLAGYDLIAMATHGRTGLKRLVMGSVTEQMMGATQLPLLVMRSQSTGAREKVVVKEKWGR